MWNAQVRRLWPGDREMPDMVKPLLDFAFPMHLAVHDAHGGDLVVEFLHGEPVFHDDPIGVLTNSPTFDWHETNLRNYVNLRDAEAKPLDLMGLEVKPTGNGTGLLGLPGDVTPPSRFVRATVLAEVSHTAKDARAAVNQVVPLPGPGPRPARRRALGRLHAVVRRPRPRWLVYHVRSYDGWTTDAHDLKALGVSDPKTARSALPLPAA